MQPPQSPPPRIILIHGFLATSRVWGPVAGRLGSAYDVRAPDLPGHGANRQGPPLSLESAVAAVAPLLDANVPATVVGHSMGAVVALAVARAFPARVARVGLISLPVYRSRQDALRYIDRRGPFYALTLRHDRLAHTGCVCLRATAPAWAPFAPRLSRGLPASLVRSWFEHSAGAHTAGLADITFAGLAPGLASAAACPVAAIHSERDTLAPIGRAEALAHDRGWRFEREPGGGHQLPVTRPGSVAAWLRTQLLG